MLQINVIREKAAEAEAIVKAITTDIQRLDIAKRNLTGAMQSLERWSMLSTLTVMSTVTSSLMIYRTSASTAQGIAANEAVQRNGTSSFCKLATLVRDAGRWADGQGCHAFDGAYKVPDHHPSGRRAVQSCPTRSGKSSGKGKRGDGHLVSPASTVDGIY
jgi:hypothetical protein